MSGSSSESPECHPDASRLAAACQEDRSWDERDYSPSPDAFSPHLNLQDHNLARAFSARPSAAESAARSVWEHATDTQPRGLPPPVFQPKPPTKAPYSVNTLKRPKCYPSAVKGPVAKQRLLPPCRTVPAKGGLLLPPQLPREAGPPQSPFPGLPKPHMRPPPRSLQACLKVPPPHAARDATVGQSLEHIAASTARDPIVGQSLEQSRSTPIAQPPQPRTSPTSTGSFSTTSALLSSRKQACLQTWKELVAMIGEASVLMKELQSSSNGDAHLTTAIAAFQPGTLECYLSIASKFVDFVMAQGQDMSSLSLAFLADFLETARLGDEEDREVCRTSPKQTLKALTWLASYAQIPVLQALLGNKLIAAFRSDVAPRDRKEALPLPLAAVAAWEVLVCLKSTAPQLRLLLGAFLLAFWASLRFGDMQRIRLSSLSLSACSLRGICYATKTTNRGQPFAVNPFGLTGRDIASSWVVAWLAELQRSWSATERHWGPSAEPDFLLPVLPGLASRAPEPFVFQLPMAYSQALPALRWALQLVPPSGVSPTTPEESLAFTVHCLKVGLLSASAQLRLASDTRRKQGHHKDSVSLYARDDTIDALWVQSEVISACAKGWRPTRPIARGGQAPTLEASFTVPRTALPSALYLPSLPPGLDRFLLHREIAQQLESHPPDPTSFAHSASDEEAWEVERAAILMPSSESEDDAPPPTARAKSFSFVQNGPWGAVHACRIGDNGEPLPACGTRLSVAALPLEEPPTSLLCKRKPCVVLPGLACSRKKRCTAIAMHATVRPPPPAPRSPLPHQGTATPGP